MKFLNSEQAVMEEAREGELEAENVRLVARLEAMAKVLAEYAMKIAELEVRVRELEGGSTPSTPTSDNGKGVIRGNELD